MQKEKISKWFCDEHPQEFLVKGDCRLCMNNINWQAKFEAGRNYWRDFTEKKFLYTRNRRLKQKERI